MTSLQWNKLMHHSLSNFHQYFSQAMRKPNKTFNIFQVLLMCGLFSGVFLSMYGWVLSGPQNHPPYTVVLPYNKVAYVLRQVEAKPDDLANFFTFTSST